MSKRPTTREPVSSRLRLPVGRLRDLPIWSKLGLIMIVPIIATIVVGTNGLVNNIGQANDADRARTLSGLSAQASALVHELQSERANAALLLGVINSPADVEARATFERQIQKTEDASQELPAHPVRPGRPARGLPQAARGDRHPAARPAGDAQADLRGRQGDPRQHRRQPVSHAGRRPAEHPRRRGRAVQRPDARRRHARRRGDLRDEGAGLPRAGRRAADSDHQGVHPAAAQGVRLRAQRPGTGRGAVPGRLRAMAPRPLRQEDRRLRPA